MQVEETRPTDISDMAAHIQVWIKPASNVLNLVARLNYFRDLWDNALYFFPFPISSALEAISENGSNRFIVPSETLSGRALIFLHFYELVVLKSGWLYVSSIELHE